MSIEAMEQALDALEKTITAFGPGLTLQQKAAAALRQAIEQAEHVHAVNTSQERVDETAKGEQDTAPPQREWFDCTDEQLIAEVRRRGFVIRDAQIEQSDQEPVLWLKTWSDGSVSVLKTKSHAFADRELEPLYTAPPKKEWVGLTDEEIEDLIYLYQKIDASNSPYFYRRGFARAIEAKLKEKNKW